MPLASGPGQAANDPESTRQRKPVVVSSRPSQVNVDFELLLKAAGVPMNAGGDIAGPVGVVSIVQS